jgi:uncharacterized protein (TIGR00730 family)
MREEMRGHRIALEFERAELAMQDHRIKSTVVVFGSSRVSEDQAAAARSKQSSRSCRGWRSKISPSACYQMARQFGRIVSERGSALSSIEGGRENVITTGGGPGIMEAANRGAADAGAPTIGLNIELPTEQAPNRYITPGLSFHFHYFAVRKMHFAMRANALAAFPGGFGTLDEVFEILTLKQARRASGMPIVLFCRDYWENVVDFYALAELSMISQADLALFQIVESAEEGWEALLDRGLTISTPLKEK